MFTEALDALATFVAAAAGVPVEVVAGSDRHADVTQGAGPGSAGVALRLVAITRSEQLRGADREVRRVGDAAAMRPGPGWYDLAVAIEVRERGDEAAVMERILLRALEAGDLGVALAVDGEYPVYARLDAAGPTDLASFWGPALGGGHGPFLACRVTAALQPFQPRQVEIVRARRIHVDDRSTGVRESVER